MRLTFCVESRDCGDTLSSYHQDINRTVNFATDEMSGRKKTAENLIVKTGLINRLS